MEDGNSQVAVVVNKPSVKISMRNIGSVGNVLDMALQSLPVRLQDLEVLSNTSAVRLLEDNTLKRLIVILLNEQDQRISDKVTKLQVCRILENVARHSHNCRIHLRLAISDIDDWCDDPTPDDSEDEEEVEWIMPPPGAPSDAKPVPKIKEREGPEPILQEQDAEIMVTIKLLLALLWRTEPMLLKQIIEDEALTLRQSKQIILTGYAATQVQSTIRGFLGRIHHRRRLQAEKEAQLNEIKRWSILILQKIARGYIARKTVLRSMQIRKALSKEVLRIAEKYLQEGDLWGFLADINAELSRSNEDNLRNQARENDWAKNFVEKVIHKRQNEFHDAWHRFPVALGEFTGKASLVGSILNPSADQSVSSINMQYNASAATEVAAKAIGTSRNKSSRERKPVNIATIKPPKKQQVSTANLKTTSMSRTLHHEKTLISADEVAIAMGNQASKSTSGFTSQLEETSRSVLDDRAKPPMQEEIRSEFPHPSEAYQFLPGPLARHALATTVQVEVTKELNSLVNGEFRSRQLTQDIRNVYGPLSDSVPKSIFRNNKSKNKSKKNATVGSGLETVNNGDPGPLRSLGPMKVAKHIQKGLSTRKEIGGNSSTALPPPSLPPKKKKKPKLGSNGLPIPDIGKIEAAHADWLGMNEKSSASSATGTEKAAFDVYSKPAEPGQTLLLDIPQGLHDTLERLLHAAALRCYVPEFFQGVVKVDPNAENIDVESLVSMASTDDSVDDLEIAEQLKKLRKEKNINKNINSDADYAYDMYQRMPMGLAKIRYELLCKKWAQGPINRLRVKGLSYIQEVVPLSKFVLCLKSVETPRALINKAVELFVELKSMANVPIGAKDPRSNTIQVKQLAPLQSAAALKEAAKNGNVVTSQYGDDKVNLVAKYDPRAAKRKARRQGEEYNELLQKITWDTAATDVTDALLFRPRSTPEKNSDQQNNIMNEDISTRELATNHIDNANGRNARAIAVVQQHRWAAVDNATNSPPIDANVDGSGCNKDTSPDTAQSGYAIDRTRFQDLSNDTDVVESDSVPTYFEMDAQKRRQLKEEQRLESEAPGKLLLDLVDADKSTNKHWSNLEAPVDNILEHAAYLVVPHYTSIEEVPLEKEENSDDEEEEEQNSDELQLKGNLVIDNDEMGNAAFKKHIAYVLKLVSPHDKRLCTKLRYRVSAKLVASCIEFLHSQGIETVREFLKVSISDLQLPEAVETQVEVLLNAAVAHAVNAKVLPIPRDFADARSSTLEDAGCQNDNNNQFMVPMYYDPKFQRGPFDPYGRPPRLQERNSHKMVKIKLKSKQNVNEEAKAAHRNLDKVSSVQQLEEDLDLPISLWNGEYKEKMTVATLEDVKKKARTTKQTKKDQKMKISSKKHKNQSQIVTSLRRLDAEYVAAKEGLAIHRITGVTGLAEKSTGTLGVLWYPTGINASDGEMDSKVVGEQSVNTVEPSFSETANKDESGSVKTESFSHRISKKEKTAMDTEESNGQTRNKAFVPNQQMFGEKFSERVASRRSRKLAEQRRKEEELERQKEHSENAAEDVEVVDDRNNDSSDEDSVDGGSFDDLFKKYLEDEAEELHAKLNLSKSINDKVFQNTFVCTHPNCGQAFARLYTYKIHMKSHELFGQYHDYKRRPQLHLDADRTQHRNDEARNFAQSTSLPPIIQQELSSLL